MKTAIPVHALHYRDVALIPNYSTLNSRSEADTTVKLGKHRFRVPVVPANMKCVIDRRTAKILDSEKCFYVMHRFDIDQYDFVKSANDEGWYSVSISVGINDSDYELLSNLYKSGLRVDFITIDIAHGHCIRMTRMLESLKPWKDRGTTIIAGNVVTEKAALDLVNSGADIVKVGVGQGHVCTTKDKTGFTMPMFTCVSNMPKNIPIIADGGVRCNGDIAKAINAGACMAMCGGLFARLLDSPAPSFEVGENKCIHKQYYGSASFNNKGYNKHIEGDCKTLEADSMTYLEKIQEITEDLQSAISYSGGKSLADLRKAEYIYQIT